jgi:tetratricopeptide (TPR) repeat protein
MIYQAIDEREMARKEYEEAIRLVPDYGVALNNFAALFFSSGEYYRARDMWDRAAKGDPFNSEYCFNLALCYSKTAEVALAIKYTKVALKLNPQLGSAYYLLGQLTREQGNYTESLNAYERFMELTGESSSPNRDEARRQIAEIKSFLGKKDLKPAVPSIQKPAQANPLAPTPMVAPKAQTGKRNIFVAALSRLFSPFKGLFSHGNHTDIAQNRP